MKNHIRLSFDFPRDMHPYLKLMCVKKGLSFKALMTELLLGALDDYEDMKLGEIAQKRLKEIEPKNNLSFQEAMKMAGWKNRD